MIPGGARCTECGAAATFRVAHLDDFAAAVGWACTDHLGALMARLAGDDLDVVGWVVEPVIA